MISLQPSRLQSLCHRLALATVIGLSLIGAGCSTTSNVKLRPQLLSQLKPGTRIVSHAFDMGDWKPDRTEQVGGSTIYFWTVPANPPANLRAVQVVRQPIATQVDEVQN